MSRREFSAKVKVAAFQRAADCCEGCGARLQVGKFHYDHIIPDGLGGEPILGNCAVLCTACHAVKTCTGDVPQIAKMKRQRAAHVGAKTRTSRPIPGSKASGWKMKMDGTVVRRER